LIPSGHAAHAPSDGLASTALKLAAAFVVISIAVGTGLMAALDAWIAQVMELPPGTAGRAVAEAVNQGGSLAIAVLAALVGLGLAGLQRRRSWLILAAPLATIPIELLAKNVVYQTPDHNVVVFQIGSLLTIPTPHTFPSGNMARVAALVFALLVRPSGARAARVGTEAGVIFAVLPAAVLIVAVWGHFASGDHWASDVLGGLVLGAAAAFALGWLTQRPVMVTLRSARLLRRGGQRKSGR
jgi:hypothetical protein